MYSHYHMEFTIEIYHSLLTHSVLVGLGVSFSWGQLTLFCYEQHCTYFQCLCACVSAVCIPTSGIAGSWGCIHSAFNRPWKQQC